MFCSVRHKRSRTLAVGKRMFATVPLRKQLDGIWGLPLRCDQKTHFGRKLRSFSFNILTHLPFLLLKRNCFLNIFPWFSNCRKNHEILVKIGRHGDCSQLNWEGWNLWACHRKLESKNFIKKNFYFSECITLSCNQYMQHLVADCAKNFHNYTYLKAVKFGSKQVHHRGDILSTMNAWSCHKCLNFTKHAISFHKSYCNRFCHEF